MNNLDASEILYAGWVAEECSNEDDGGIALPIERAEDTEAHVSVLHPF